MATSTIQQTVWPFIFQGDELGMTNFPFNAIGQFDDISARNLWHDEVDGGHVTAAEMLAILRKTSRDNARTPMQWSADAGAGFTTGHPWLAVNPNHTAINAAVEARDPASVLNFYRRLIALRGRAPVLVRGDYHDIAPENPDVYAFTRNAGDDHALVAGQ